MTLRPCLQSTRRGQIILLLALVLVLALGVGALVLDLGLSYLEKARLQNVVDTAALAAAKARSNEASAVVSEVTQANGYVVGQRGVVSIELIPNPDGQHPGRFLVRIRKAMPPLLSTVWDHQGTLLEARAVAECLVKGVVPWMFYLPDIPYFVKGTEYTIKQGPFGAQFGNFGALRLSGSGAAEYVDDIVNGYDGYLYLGQELQTQPGNMSGPTRTAVNQRIRDGNLQIVCPVTSDAVPQGASETLTVEGFAILELQRTFMQSGECMVVAKFLDFTDSPGPVGVARLIR